MKLLVRTNDFGHVRPIIVGDGSLDPMAFEIEAREDAKSPFETGAKDIALDLGGGPDELGILNSFLVDMKERLVPDELEFFSQTPKVIKVDAECTGLGTGAALITADYVPKRRDVWMKIEHSHGMRDQIVIKGVRRYSEEIKAMRGIRGMNADECAALQDRVADFCEVALKSSLIALHLFCYEHREFLDAPILDSERFKPISDVLHIVSAQAAGAGRSGGK